MIQINKETNTNKEDSSNESIEEDSSNESIFLSDKSNISSSEDDQILSSQDIKSDEESTDEEAQPLDQCMNC